MAFRTKCKINNLYQFFILFFNPLTICYCVFDCVITSQVSSFELYPFHLILKYLLPLILFAATILSISNSSSLSSSIISTFSLLFGGFTTLGIYSKSLPIYDVFATLPGILLVNVTF